MFDTEFFNLGHLDSLSYRDTFIHRLDPKAKLIATAGFVIAVVSFSKYEITGLFPFLLFPALLFSLGDIPVMFILKKVFFVSFFAAFIGIFNPFFDRQTIHTLYGHPVSGGWISFVSIMLKFCLTVTSALLLVATTSFPRICHALQEMGVPRIFVSQLLFLYRYLFVLAEETMKVIRAREMRSVGGKGRDVRTFISIVGALFLRTVERAERIYQAMLSRGFSGTIHVMKPGNLRLSDAVFLVLALTFLYLFRMYDVVGLIGRSATRVF